MPHLHALPRFITALMLVLLAASPALHAQQTPPGVDAEKYLAFERQVAQAYAAKDYERALNAVDEMLALAPGDPRVLYNAACIYALLKNKPRALAMLESAVDAGFTDAKQIAGDSDLSYISEEPQFKELLTRLREGAPRRATPRDKIDHDYVRILAPEGGDAKSPRPLVVVLHGYGGNADAVAEVWQEAAKNIDAILVAPQGGMATSDTDYHWGDADKAAAQIEKALEKARQSHSIDESRMVLAGFSQGGTMAVQVACRPTQPWRGVVCVAGAYLQLSGELLTHAGQQKLTIVNLVGEKDERVLRTMRDAQAPFEQAGCTFAVQLFPDVAHDYPPQRTEELTRALRVALGSPEP